MASFGTTRQTGSCESGRCLAYSKDLCWCIVYQRLGLDFSCWKVASNLGVDPSTVSHIVQQFQRTSSVKKDKYNCSTLPQKLTDVVQFPILQLVIERPGIFFHEIQTEVEYVMKIDLAPSTICQFLHAQGFSRQRIQLMTKQRDEVIIGILQMRSHSIVLTCSFFGWNRLWQTWCFETLHL